MARKNVVKRPLEMYRGSPVAYLKNQTRTLFFRLYAYPAFKLGEKGQLEEDKSESVVSFRKEMSDLSNVLDRVVDKYERYKRFPKSDVDELERGWAKLGHLVDLMPALKEQYADFTQYMEWLREFVAKGDYGMPPPPPKYVVKFEFLRTEGVSLKETLRKLSYDLDEEELQAMVCG